MPFRGRVVQSAVAVPFYAHALISRVISCVSAEHARKLAVEERQRWLREAPLRDAKEAVIDERR